MKARASMHRWGQGLLAGLLLAVGASCDRARVFEENRKLADSVWRAEEKPAFAFTITDTTARYDVFLNVRTTVHYRFYNLFVKLTLTGPDASGTTAGSNSRVVSRLLHELRVADPQTGEPLGDGAGDIFDHQVSALRGVRFRQPGTYHAELEQYMRLAALPDVMDVGLRVARQEPTK